MSDQSRERYVSKDSSVGWTYLIWRRALLRILAIWLLLRWWWLLLTLLLALWRRRPLCLTLLWLRRRCGRWRWRVWVPSSSLTWLGVIHCEKSRVVTRAITVLSRPTQSVVPERVFTRRSVDVEVWEQGCTRQGAGRQAFRCGYGKMWSKDSQNASKEGGRSKGICEGSKLVHLAQNPDRQALCECKSEVKQADELVE